MSGSKKIAEKSGSSVQMYTFLVSGRVKGGQSVVRSYRDAGAGNAILYSVHI